LKGNYKELNNHDAVAIIGTREPTDAGIISAKFFGEQFGRKGYNVVSGLC
jgi:predicted Rossmann fold nucleotide-binding protein DprA/Smf involved in DNA uptake